MRGYVMESPGMGSVQEIPDPSMGDYEAMVDIVVCGICSSTDKMLRMGTFRQPVGFPSVLGHESVGRVVATGDRVRHLNIGDLVTRPSAYGTVGAPLAMHWGGFAEQGVVTDWRALQEDLPEEDTPTGFPHVAFSPETSPEHISLGITLSETFSVICRQDVLGKKVGVVGTGAAGLSFIVYAKFLGAAQVVAVGRRRERLELASHLGADVLLNSTDAATDGVISHDLGGLDLVFEASGDAAMVARTFSWLVSGGACVVYSAPERCTELDLMAMPREATLEVARTHEAAVLPGVVDLIQGRIVDPEFFITHRYGLENIADGFRDIDEGVVLKAMVSTQQ